MEWLVGYFLLHGCEYLLLWISTMVLIILILVAATLAIRIFKDFLSIFKEK
jgi:hypothetical protein